MKWMNGLLLVGVIAWGAWAFVITPAWNERVVAELADQFPPISVDMVAVVEAYRSRATPTVVEGRLFGTRISKDGHEATFTYRFGRDGQLVKSMVIDGQYEVTGMAPYRFEGAVMVFELDEIKGAKILFPEIGEAVVAISDSELVLAGAAGGEVRLMPVTVAPLSEIVEASGGTDAATGAADAVVWSTFWAGVKIPLILAFVGLVLIAVKPFVAGNSAAALSRKR